MKVTDTELMEKLHNLFSNIYHMKSYTPRELQLYEDISKELEKRGYTLKTKTELVIDCELPF